MQKILFITKNMACGGVERTLLNLLESLDREKYRIDLLLLEKSGDFLDLVPFDVGVSEVQVSEKRRFILSCSEKSFKDGFFELWSKKRYGTATEFLFLKFLTRLGLRIDKKPFLYYVCLKNAKLPEEAYDVVCDYHGYGYLTTYLAADMKAEKKYSWIHIEKIDSAFFSARKVYPLFDGFFGVSPDCVLNFQKAFPELNADRIKVLYNLIPKKKIQEMSRESPVISYDTENRFVMVSVGRLSTQKGFDLAIETAHLLKQRGRKFLWLIVGEGPERNFLESQIASFGLEEDVILHGLDKNPYSYMALADLYVQCSRYEGFATTLSEAIILEKPIVSTSFSGVDEQVVEEKNGLLAKFDPDDLAEKLERMMDDPAFRKMCGERCSDIKLPMDQTLDYLEMCFD